MPLCPLCHFSAQYLSLKFNRAGPTEKNFREMDRAEHGLPDTRRSAVLRVSVSDRLALPKNQGVASLPRGQKEQYLERKRVLSRSFKKISKKN